MDAMKKACANDYSRKTRKADMKAARKRLKAADAKEEKGK